MHDNVFGTPVAPVTATQLVTLPADTGPPGGEAMWAPASRDDTPASGLEFPPAPFGAADDHVNGDVAPTASGGDDEPPQTRVSDDWPSPR